MAEASGAELVVEVARLIVGALNLEVTPQDIDPQAPLYGEGTAGNGLGLDSIDILEVALVVSRHYGVELRADSEENVTLFGSLDNLVTYIAAHRTR